MRPRIFAVFDKDGLPRGFYPSDIWPTPPENAIEISRDDYQEFLEYQGQRRWDGKRPVDYAPPPSHAPINNDPEKAKTLSRLAEESAAMDAAIAATVRAWSGLENALAYLLGTIIGHNGGALGMAIYYTPNATEVRMSIVDEALKQFLLARGQQGEQVSTYWKTLYKRIQRCKSTRNDIIHGNVSTFVFPGREQKIRLVDPIFDMSVKRTMELASSMSAATPQYPGKSPHDVRGAAQNFGTLAEGVNKMRLVVSQMQRETWNDEAFQEKCRELANHLRSALSPTPDAQTPPEHGDQPPSSQ